MTTRTNLPRDLEEEATTSEPPAAPPEQAPQQRYQPGDQVIIRGRPGAWNYTYGPVLVYRGPRTIDEIYHQGEPVVVVADTIPMDELSRIDLSRVRGFILEEGSTQDEELFNFLQTENRAAVIGCEGALYFAREGGWVIVDGVQGMVCFNPTDETLERFEAVRAAGPPKRERMAQVESLVEQMIEDAAKRREEQKASGEYVDDHAMTNDEVMKAHQERPGIVLQLLSGLPIQGAPGGEGDHGHAPAGEAEPAPPTPEEPKRLTAAERRAERDAQQERDGGPDEKEAAAAEPSAERSRA